MGVQGLDKKIIYHLLYNLNEVDYLKWRLSSHFHQLASLILVISSHSDFLFILP
jgi:hypothetical protein